ncbi:MAG: choice-of-anchor J domain-containing protein [Muribaculaceae bacterium]
MKKISYRLATLLLFGVTASAALADNEVFVERFDTQEDFQKWTIINVEEGSVTWTYRTSTGKPMQSKCAQILKHSPNAANDWLISQPIELHAGTLYELSFRATAGTFNKSEHLKAFLGSSQSAEGMTCQLTDLDNLIRDDSSDINRSADFSVDTDGTYYLGFLGCSMPDQGRIDLDDIVITEKASSNAPAPIENLTIIPGSQGALTATISFTAPSLTATGASLSSLTNIEIYRDGALISTIENPTPGAEQCYTDNSAAQGFNTYSVICDANGDKSVETTAKAFIGIDVPVAVVNPRATCLNDGLISLSWNTPESSVNGGYFDPTSLTYIIKNLGDGTETTVNGNSHQLQFSLGEQALYEFSIAPVAEAGTGADSRFNRVIMGNPITAAFSESFANGSAHSLWYQDSDDADFEWITDDPENDEYSVPDVKGYTVYAQDGDHGALMAITEYAFDYDSSRYCSPIFNLSNFENPVFTFYLINGPKDVLRLQVRTAGGEWSDVAEAVWETGINGLQWSRCSTPLANLKDLGDIQFSFLAAGGARILHIDNISVAEAGFAHDIAIRSISASPRRANIGETTTFSVDLRNFGGSDESYYSVVLYRDGVEMDRKSGSELAATESTVIEFSYTATLDDAIAEKKCEWNAEVILDSDSRSDNNISKPVIWSVRLNDVPDASGLTVAPTAEGMSLAWNAAESRDASEKGEINYITDDFESYTPFAIENVGDWTLVDKDGAATWNTNYPTRPLVGEPLSFMVFNTVEGEVQTDEHQDNIFFAHSGHQYMMGFSNAEYGTANDDWLISPRLDGRAHTIDFFARIPMGMSGDDIIDVAYSTTDTDPDSFSPLAGGKNIHIQDAWQHVTLDVPDGARYCAVNLKLSQMFFELDDFTYAAHDGSADPLSLLGYNVYRNGEKINDQLIAQPEYLDSSVQEGATVTYKVSAVYEQGESRYSNEVTVTATGVEKSLSGKPATIAVNGNRINIKASHCANVEIHRIDGTSVLRQRAASVDTTLQPGIYIITIDSTAMKIRI